jgi:carboxymethylenebutenolidase
MSDEQIPVGDGRVNAYAAGDSEFDAPGVALFHPWWGLNEDVKAFADRLAHAGFFVLAPDMFGGEVATEIAEAERLASSTDEATADSIAGVALDRLASRSTGPGRIGTVGFSFGAHWSVWSSGHSDRVAASVVYYGTTGGPVLSAGMAPILGNFAEDDPFEDAAGVAAFAAGLRGVGRGVTTYIYAGTGHWFAEPSRDAYRPEAADHAFERTVAFLRLALSGEA